MTLPIKPGTAARLGLHQPKRVWIDEVKSWPPQLVTSDAFARLCKSMADAMRPRLGEPVPLHTVDARELMAPIQEAARAERKRECEDRGVHVFAKGALACPHCDTPYTDLAEQLDMLGLKPADGKAKA